MTNLNGQWLVFSQSLDRARAGLFVCEKPEVQVAEGYGWLVRQPWEESLLHASWQTGSPWET